jgi:peptidoglycan/LPS O-acetylase OafA/YrhL
MGIAVKNNKWIKGVDSIRFILALVVLLSHFDDPYMKLCLQSSSQPVKILGLFLANTFDGTAAVIAFFIISGFVIHYANKDGIKSLSTFYIRRFSRIMIPLLVIYLIGIKFNHPDKSVIWSLICELIYYAIYPFLFRIKTSWRNKFIFFYIIAAIVIVVKAHTAVSALLTQSNTDFPMYYWQLGVLYTWIIGLPVWLLGVLIAENIDELKSVSLSKIVLFRTSVFIISVLLNIGKTYWNLSYLLSMNIFAILLFKWLEAEIIYHKNKQPVWLLEYMGKFSYSLYLCHPLIYAILILIMGNTLVTYPLIILITILSAYLFYLAIERPSHLLAIKWTTKPKTDI